MSRSIGNVFFQSYLKYSIQSNVTCNEVLLLPAIMCYCTTHPWTTQHSWIVRHRTPQLCQSGRLRNEAPHFTSAIEPETDLLWYHVKSFASCRLNQSDQHLFSPTGYSAIYRAVDEPHITMIARGENQEVPQTTPLRPSHGPTDVAQDSPVPSHMQAAMAQILEFMTLQEQELTADFFLPPHGSTRRCSLLCRYPRANATWDSLGNKFRDQSQG